MLGAAIVVGVIVAYVVYSRYSRKERYLVEMSLPTSPEVEYIQGQPDHDVVRLPDGGEFIRPGDIALNPGFGVGEGTFGFGRYGLSFMA